MTPQQRSAHITRPEGVAPGRLLPRRGGAGPRPRTARL